MRQKLEKNENKSMAQPVNKNETLHHKWTILLNNSGSFKNPFRPWIQHCKEIVGWNEH